MQLAAIAQLCFAAEEKTPLEPSPGYSHEASRTVSLKECFELAQQRSRELIAARYNLPIAEASIKIASAIPNPRFSLYYGWGPAYELIIAGNPQQFGFEQQLQLGGKRAKAITLANEEYKIAQTQLAALSFDLHNRVRRAYAELAAAEAYYDLIVSQKTVAISLYEHSLEKYKAGMATEADTVHAHLGVMQFDVQKRESEERLQKASTALSVLLGELPHRVELIEVTDHGIFKLNAEKSELVPLPINDLPRLSELIPDAFANQKELKIAMQVLEADKKDLILAKARRIPDMFVDTGYQFTTFKKYQPFSLASGPVPNTPGAYLNINMEHPFFYQQQGEIAESKAIIMRDIAQSETVKSKVARDVVIAYEALSVAKLRINKFQSDILPETAEIAQLAMKNFQVQKSGLTVAILGRQQYQTILSNYFDAVVDYQNAWADLEKALGVAIKL